MATWEELAALRPGAAVCVHGEEFVIERTLCFDQAECVWYEHRLSSDASGRSLWLEIPADPEDPVIAYEHGAVLDHVPDAAQEIEHRGERMQFVMSARASYRSIERASAPKSGELIYHEYAKGDRRVTYETRGDGTWEVSEGRTIDAAEIGILA